jgi:hypothetical protein
MVVYDTISSVLIQFHGVLCAMVFRRLSAQKNGDTGSIDVLFFWRLLGMTAWEINQYGIKQCECICMHELLSLGDRRKLGNSVPSLYIFYPFHFWTQLLNKHMDGSDTRYYYVLAKSTQGRKYTDKSMICVRFVCRRLTKIIFLFG